MRTTLGESRFHHRHRRFAFQRNLDVDEMAMIEMNPAASRQQQAVGALAENAAVDKDARFLADDRQTVGAADEHAAVEREMRLVRDDEERGEHFRRFDPNPLQPQAGLAQNIDQAAVGVFPVVGNGDILQRQIVLFDQEVRLSMEDDDDVAETHDF